jgi:hypothetical protein
MIRIRKSRDRGHRNYQWLETRQTFSHGGYFDPNFMDFGQIRVLDENIIQGDKTFPEHVNSDYEIITYVVRGSMRYKDGEDHEKLLHRGGAALVSAGKGIRHKQQNANEKEPVHYVEVWVKPKDAALKPEFHATNIPDEDRLNKLVCFVAPKGMSGTANAEPEGTRTPSLPINQDFYALATVLEPGKSVAYSPTGAYPEHRRLYVFVPNEPGTAVKVTTNKGEETLEAGDGAFIDKCSGITLTGASTKTQKAVEVILLDSE